MSNSASAVTATAAAVGAVGATTAAATATTKRRGENEGNPSASKKIKPGDDDGQTCKRDAIKRSLSRLGPKPPTADWSPQTGMSQLDAVQYCSLLRRNTLASIAEAHAMTKRIGVLYTSSEFLPPLAIEKAWLDLNEYPTQQSTLYDLLYVVRPNAEILSTLMSIIADRKLAIAKARVVLRLVEKEGGWIGLHTSVVNDMIANGGEWMTVDDSSPSSDDGYCTCVFCSVFKLICEPNVIYYDGFVNNLVVSSDGRVYTALQHAVKLDNSHAVYALLQFIPVVEIDVVERAFLTGDKLKELTRADGTDEDIPFAVPLKIEPIISFFTIHTSPVIKQLILVALQLMEGYRYNRHELVCECLYETGLQFDVFNLVREYGISLHPFILSARACSDRS